MKKLFYITIGFLIILPLTSYADSGACSWHGGVDCAAGPGIYGQVICNDGWTGSSVSYSSMSECQPTTTDSCTSLLPDCDPSSYDTLISQAEGNAAAQCVANGLAGSSACNPEQAAQPYIEAKAACEVQTAAYQSCLNAQQQLWQQEQQQQQNSPLVLCAKVGGYLDSNGQCQCPSGDVYSKTQNQCIPANSYCTSLYGPNSYADLSNNTCACSSGYIFQNGECITQNEACQNIYGQSAFANPDGSCACPAEETPDAVNHLCIYKSPATTQTASVDQATQVEQTNTVSIPPKETVQSIPVTQTAPILTTNLPIQANRLHSSSTTNKTEATSSTNQSETTTQTNFLQKITVLLSSFWKRILSF